MKKVRIIMTATLILFGILCTMNSFAADDEKKTAVSMVNDAVKMMKTAGKAKTLAAISDPQGAFVKGEIYVFAYDFNGVIVAHPKNPKLIGKNLFEVPDVDGKLFRKDIVAIAKKKETGWVDYKYKNPESGKIEHKTTYVTGAEDIAVCCGVYK